MLTEGTLRYNRMISKVNEVVLIVVFFFLRNWKMRWFVLRDSKLMYYENDSEEKLKGTIDIRAAKYNLKLPDKKPQKQRHFIQSFNLLMPTADLLVILQGDRGQS